MTIPPAIHEVEQALSVALGTYSNVHRGSGHHSMVTTRLYERARNIVVEHLGLSCRKHVVIFCTPRRAKRLEARLVPGTYHCVSSQEVGLPLGLRALVVRRKDLPKGAPCETGGGTARLVGPGWVIWAKGPDRFEPGTPAITNVIAFARALQLRNGADPAGHLAPAPVTTTSGEETGQADLDGLSGAELLAALREGLIGRGARVPTADGDRTFVNFDNAASTPTFRPIWAEVCRAWRTPIQEHGAIIQRARTVCADVLGARPDTYDVLFTSNTTEAINLVAESLGKTAGPDVEPVVLNTLLEHNSNELPWRSTPGLELVRLPVDEEGFVDQAELEAQLRAYNETRSHGKKRITLVAVSGASNVFGVYNDVAEIGRLAHRYGARLLVDAAQWVAHRKVDVEACDIDYLAFSGHKVYAPFGSGVLMARKGLLRFSAAEMDEIRSSGEENVGGIAAIAEALDLLRRIGFDRIQADEQDLTRRALSGLKTLPRVRVHGLKELDSPRFASKGGVIVFDVKGRLPGAVARALAEGGGIGVRYGCHCAHLAIKHLLRVPPWAERLQYWLVTLIPPFSPPGLVRISFGLQNSAAEIDRFVEQMAAPGGHRRNRDLKRRMNDFVRAAVEDVFGAVRLG